MRDDIGVGLGVIFRIYGDFGPKHVIHQSPRSCLYGPPQRGSPEPPSQSLRVVSPDWYDERCSRRDIDNERKAGAVTPLV